MRVDEPPLDPGAVFSSPCDVLRRTDLTREEKVEILRHWADDASALAVAQEEGMRNGDDDLLRQILLALQRLTPSRETVGRG